MIHPEILDIAYFRKFSFNVDRKEKHDRKLSFDSLIISLFDK